MSGLFLCEWADHSGSFYSSGSLLSLMHLSSANRDVERSLWQKHS